MAFPMGKRCELRLAPYYSWSGTMEMTPTLLRSLEISDGLLFVVDDRLLDDASHCATVIERLQTLLDRVKKRTPILILNFCDENTEHVHNPQQALALLGMDEPTLARKVSLRNVPEMSDVGVAEGVEWLVEAMM